MGACSPAALAASIVALLAAGSARAASEPDPRWLYTVELGLGIEAVGEISSPSLLGSTRNELATAVVRPLMLFPVAQSVQASGGLIVGGGGYGRAVGGVRYLTGADTWQTKLDLQGLVGLVNSISLGVRVGVGASWEFSPKWRLGADAGASISIGHVIAALDAQATIAWGF